MQIMETVRNQVREYRVAKGITQEELAAAVSVSRQTIIAIEKGSYVPSVLLALRLAQHFKLPVEKLFIL